MNYQSNFRTADASDLMTFAGVTPMPNGHAYIAEYHNDDWDVCVCIGMSEDGSFYGELHLNTEDGEEYGIFSMQVSEYYSTQYKNAISDIYAAASKLVATWQLGMGRNFTSLALEQGFASL